MLKKVAYSIVAGSLLFAAQAVSADDTQFDIGGGRYLGVSALPFHATGAPRGEAAAPMAASERLESTHAGAVVTRSTPAPYNAAGGYFN